MSRAEIDTSNDTRVCTRIGATLRLLVPFLGGFFGISPASEPASPITSDDSNYKTDSCEDNWELLYPNDKMKRLCPVCQLPVPNPGGDHRFCLVELFKTNRIQCIQDWMKMSIVRTRIRVPAAETTRERPAE